MSRFDSDSSTTTGVKSEFVQGLRGATRIFEKYELAVKAALLFATTAALGYGWHAVATQQFGNNMSALLVWFSLIFAASSALVAGSIKLWGAVQQRRHDWE